MENKNYWNNGKLENEDIARYSRQLILPQIGVEGQIKLKASRVLLIGLGGLGCPAALYLAAAGVGYLGLLDYDDVDKSNLHRQVLHSEENLGIPKVSSASQYIKRLNSSVECTEYHLAWDNASALGIVHKYLVNDACVLAGKPLISGSALRFEGQLTIYNYKDGPCYRCLYPHPSPAETVTNCSDGGIIGAVTGMIGSLQALESIKILVGIEPAYAKKLLIFDGMTGEIRIVKLRGKKQDCLICGAKPSITSLQDYEAFCGAAASDKCSAVSILPQNERISVEEYKSVINKNEDHILIDVRPEVEFQICSLSTARNIPMSRLSDENEMDHLFQTLAEFSQPVYVICKQGNDSQKAVTILKKDLQKHRNYNHLIVKDIIGGLFAWSTKIDKNFPVY